MARSRRGRPVHGWVILDKPLGLGSTAAVGAIRRLFDAQKAGHGGTLDPLATGVLPIALGEATKTVPFVMDGAKAYRFTVAWGEARDTDDREGAVTATSPVRPDAAAIEAALPCFVGDIEQVPPAFSAIRVGGRRAYDLARADAAPLLAPRRVRVDSLVLVDRPDADHAVFETRCGKGTYVRGLARDLARALGTVGHVAALRRTRAGPFTEAQAILLDKLEGLRHIPRADSVGGPIGADPLLAHMLPIDAALDDIPALVITGSEAARLRNGQPVPVLRTRNRETIAGLADGTTMCAKATDGPVALVRLDGPTVRPVRVLNL